MTYWTRSAVEHWSGKPAPPDLYGIRSDWRGERHVITYAEHMAEKRGWQRERLRRKLHIDPWQAWLLSVRWCAGLGEARFFLGYFVALYRPCREKLWLRDFSGVRRLLPLGLLPTVSGEDWKLAFVKRYRVGTRNGHPFGSRVVWKRGRELALRMPERARGAKP